MKHSNTSIQRVADYLVSAAQKDEQLKNAIDQMDENKKTLDLMWSYIVNKAKEQLSGKDGAIEDSMVYGWAVHYMIETNEMIQEEMPKQVERKEAPKTEKTENVEVKVKKEKNAALPKGYINVQQLSLFGD